MKSSELQQLVKKLFGDEKTRREFQKDPNSILDKYNLTEKERKAIFNTHAKLGLATTGSEQFETTLDATSGWGAPMP